MGEAPTEPLENLGIAGWFAPENRITLDALIKECSIGSVTEIGSFMGLSAVWFARRVNSVTCVDSWFEPANAESQNNLLITMRRWGIPRDFFHMFAENVMRSGQWHKILPLRGTSTQMVEQVPVSDLVYIDGDHSYEGCKRDIEIYRDKARVLICGDDYADREGFGVIQAVSEAFPDHKHFGPFWWAIL